MKLVSNSFADGATIPGEYAFGVPADDAPMQFGANRNPHLAWSEVPDGTQSFVLLCVDPDVPGDASQVNTEGVVLQADAPRVDFYHWVMIDLPADRREIAAGSCSDGVIEGGKQDPAGPIGSRQGRNGYTEFLAGSDLAGNYYGYDGPCPPWNDERLHHYHFRLHALAVPRLEVSQGFRGDEVIHAMDQHVLATAQWVGTYSLFGGAKP